MIRKQFTLPFQSKRSPGGYRTVPLNGGRDSVYVHIAVLTAFRCPRPFPEAQGRHLDDNKLNNCLDNLEWGTPRENMADALANGKLAACNVGKTHCKRGHPFDEANTYRFKQFYKGRISWCRQCKACKSLLYNHKPYS